MDRARIDALQREGQKVWEKFDLDVRRQDWHPFMPASYDRVRTELERLYTPGSRFLEWGSATGVITIMADMIGYEAYGIELDDRLVEIARELAARFDSGARFVAGSFLPEGYVWRSPEGDSRQGTIGDGRAGYAELGMDLSDFDYVFVYPWPGEDIMMRDIVSRHGGGRARLLQYSGAGIEVFGGPA